MAKGFILCADDFAMTAGVSRAILDLLGRGKLTATGAMTNRPHWRRLAPELAAFAGQADLGLHLNLTCAAPISVMPRLAPGGALPGLKDVARAAVLSPAVRAEIAAEIARQLDAFEQALGRPPDFVDGHQHVHVLPGVREALVAELLHRYPKGRVWVRDCVETPARCLRRGEATAKALFIGALGFGLRRQLRDAALPANDGFSGLHDFSTARPFGDKMRRFLRGTGPRPLLHVHPGRVDAALRACDALTTPREAELDYLASSEFASDLVAAGLRPARFAEMGPSPTA